MKPIEFLTLVMLLIMTHCINPIVNSPASERNQPPNLLKNYIPASMHVLHHCIESIQYEPVMMSMVTTAKPTTTTTAAPQRPTTFHKPGYFGPAQPPPTPATAITSPTSNVTHQEQTTKPSTETTETLLWNDKQFFEWFLQSKYKQIKLDNEYDLQLLDPLPYRLRQDIDNERNELPALLDIDNVNEFRRIYDDKYPGGVDSLIDSHKTNNGGNTEDVNNRISGSGNPGGKGKKRVPPTKPYIHMLMLYDLLKREAKKFMFNMSEGYGLEIISYLSQIKANSCQQQLLSVLARMLEEKNIEKADVVSRTKAMIAELENPNGQIATTLSLFPPLVFVP
ncbi:uncharacterized protein LOC129776708 [Toxorhynchites rutilus septentrionalis]|uniref:uncharacterized protein LOC129776708 n=1 Tax=Toxorhynchites rutilus septentrionalis TaxID=329112 RepID=UPI0024797579|nr:uncharacterized protein LOC129776708 [Toxorhynchites rutilus septentrionalis]